jgi:hypothetical protein
LFICCTGFFFVGTGGLLFSHRSGAARSWKQTNGAFGPRSGFCSGSLSFGNGSEAAVGIHYLLNVLLAKLAPFNFLFILNNKKIWLEESNPKGYIFLCHTLKFYEAFSLIDKDTKNEGALFPGAAPGVHGRCQLGQYCNIPILMEY